MRLKISAVSLALGLLSGCATQQQRDPYESYNRAMFNFNQVAYDYALIPAAEGYDYVVPDGFQRGIYNAYTNLQEPARVANDLLQGQLMYALEDTSRFVINTVFGLFGLFDAAKYAGLPRRSYQGFDVTMAKWGYRYSPYIVWPFVGPKTVGASIAAIPDSFGNPLEYVHPWYIGWGAFGLYQANMGVAYLPLYSSLVNSSFDSYIAVRSAYLQNYDYEVDRILGVPVSPVGAQDHQEILDILDSE